MHNEKSIELTMIEAKGGGKSCKIKKMKRAH